jgi:hypothetical protein
VTLKRSRAALDRDTWRRAVGRRIAERTDVGSLRDGELTVYVASAAWAQELSLLTREITSCLEALGIRVERVRFRVRADLAKNPKSAAAPARPKHVRPLPPELSERVARIEDPELRAAITQAAGLALTRLEHEASAATRRRATKGPSAGPRAARGLPGAEAGSARPGPESAVSGAATRDTRAGRRG